MREAAKTTGEMMEIPASLPLSRPGPLPSACPEESNHADVTQWLTVALEVISKQEVHNYFLQNNLARCCPVSCVDIEFVHIPPGAR